MEATAHVTDDGEVFFSYPPGRDTAERTIQAVSDCLSGGTRLEVRRYRDEAGESHAGVDALVWEVIRLGGTVSDVVVPTT